MTESKKTAHAAPTSDTGAPRALVAAAFVVLGLVVYAPALDGPFISDDLHYVSTNQILQAFDFRTFAEILDPTGVMTLLVENYAPVHLILHAVEWQLFGPDTLGYHVVNVLLHALASFLLVLLFERTGLSRNVALVGGGLFLVHAANVEAVAWISQLKSPAAMVMAVGALLVHPRRPVLAASLFTLALFAKPSALFALPVLIIWTWVVSRDEGAGAEGWRWKWVGIWALLFVAFAGVELLAFSKTAATASSMYEGTAVRFRSGAAIGVRYLVMFATTIGLSTFHEPDAVESWFDPWWLASIPVFAWIGWRIFVALRGRRMEAVYWAWAAAAFSPVSGLLQLPFPMADRYLYTIMPGLLGVLLFSARDIGDWLRARGGGAARLDVARVALGLAVVIAVGFAWRSHERSRVWTSSYLVLADSERHYPEGRAALTRRSRAAARNGDADGAVEALRAAYEKGYDRLEQVVQDPAYEFLRDRPDFRAIVDAMADDLIARYVDNEDPSQQELHAIAFAYNAKRETAAAVAALERALERDGPITPQIEEDLRELQTLLRIEEIRRRKSGASERSP